MLIKNNPTLCRVRVLLFLVVTACIKQKYKLLPLVKHEYKLISTNGSNHIAFKFFSQNKVEKVNKNFKYITH